MKAINTFTVVYCPVSGCSLETPFSLAKELLDHLSSIHSINIHEPASVAPFIDRYLAHYKDVLSQDFVGTLGGDPVKFPEDQNIRQELHLKMLEVLLEMQQMERVTVYKKERSCLFCSTKTTLPELFAHMFNEHHFNIGLLDNLIFVDTFMNELEEMLALKKQCLYCKEAFRNGTCLRKHLKSKNHFKINGKDERWDRFYLVNYVNLTKNNSSCNSGGNEGNEADEVSGEVDWEDLKDEIDLQTQCLFCDLLLADPEDCFEHLLTSHSFNIQSIQLANKLTFYDTMKLINYFRNCQRQDKYPFKDDLVKDCPLSLNVHFQNNEIPDGRHWNRPEYYFPVYEEDPLLTAIEDDYEEEEED